jgi:hypothetical protein
MTLFEKKNRTHLEPALHNENTFDYYDRSARKDVTAVRKVLNEWFDNYPKIEQHELKSRFKKTFSSAFYELFIFSLFKSQGFEIVIHPIIPNSKKRPDFLLKKANIEFYLEAKEARDKTQEEEAQQKRINETYDSLNKLNSPNFFLRIEELILKTNIQPAIKKIIPRIEDELIKICPDKVTEDLEKNGYDSSPRITIEDENLKLTVSLIPKSPENRDKGGRPIGAYSFEAYYGGAENSIKNSFSKKAKRYGKLDKPYIICINAIGSKFSGDYDIENAVWGTQSISWSDDPNNKDEKLIRQRDGIFMGYKGPIFKNVSGVFITYTMEFNIPSSNYWLIKHPFTTNDLDFDVFQLSYQYLENYNINSVQGKSIGELLKIKPDWLNEK